MVVTWSCADNGSGPVASPVTETVSGEGANLSATGTCTDLAGNTASDTQTGINIDRKAPTITYVGRTAANANGWNNGDVTVTWTCSDGGGSGVVDGSVTETVSTEGENQSASGTCTDQAGNTASDTQNGINIDLTRPDASASAAPGPNSNGWNNAAVTVTFSGTDNLSGLDFCTAPEELDSEGSGQSASGTCTDKAGNVSDQATAAGINIDLTKPDASASAAPGPNLNGWNKTNVTVSFSGTDGLSRHRLLR